MGDKFYAYTDALHALEAHSRHYAPSPRREEDKNFLPYVGNGHVGVEIAPAAAGSNLYIFGRRHLNVKVCNNMRPLKMTPVLRFPLIILSLVADFAL